MPEEARGYTVTSVRRRTVRQKAPQICDPEAVYRLMRRRIGRLDREHFYAVLLNTRNVVISIELVSVGSLNASIVHPREIFKPAVVQSAAGIVLVHNHPTGDPQPSKEDVDFTRRFSRCGQLMGIQLLDHVIVGAGDYTSLKENGDF